MRKTSIKIGSLYGFPLHVRVDYNNRKGSPEPTYVDLCNAHPESGLSGNVLVMRRLAIAILDLTGGKPTAEELNWLKETERETAK